MRSTETITPKTEGRSSKETSGSNLTRPGSSDGGSLGSTSKEWSDLYLADGGIINLGMDSSSIVYKLVILITVNFSLKS